jgi:large subunit ribosomal protein L9
MKLLLTKDVQGLGRIGDIKEVSDGHARNFLIPRGFALPATSGMLAKVQKEEQEKQQRIAKDQERVVQLKNKMAGKQFDISAKASNSSLFAAIHEKDVAAAINHKFPGSITAEQIELEKAIKTLGEHEVGVKLTDTVKFKIRLNIKPL